jgi:CheY-like chemotaxis protein
MSQLAEAILVVEDSVTNRNILVHLLKKLGYAVVEASDGNEALKQLEAPPEGAQFVAILSDMMMPNRDGISLLKAVRELDPYKNIPFVIVTAVADKNYIIQAKALNVHGYILKPVTFQRVQNKLQELFPSKVFPKVAG